MKTCFKCMESKIITEFYKHSEMKDGVLGKCKECAKKDVLLHRSMNLEKIRAYDRKRGRTDSRIELNRKVSEEFRKNFPEKKLEISRAYNLKYPEKYKARTMLNNYIRDKKLVKPSNCEKCKSTKIQGHHEDYSNPLNVRWLCQKHHKELHRSYISE